MFNYLVLPMFNIPLENDPGVMQKIYMSAFLGMDVMPAIARIKDASSGNFSTLQPDAYHSTFYKFRHLDLKMISHSQLRKQFNPSTFTFLA
ncbi:Hypothetical predicted protein [Cloeon dipterum]|uniref:Uncharacterized protein n=1 Tax=Cloeon dipterum TaxID=197152 RepID=A0A8S1DLA6_9INSE|nr:Hypothetical predicted protein [Cloeon dipterum]